MAISPYPDEVLGRVLRFLPKKQIYNIATADNNLPDIFLLFAPYDGVFKPILSNGKIMDYCLTKPGVFNIYQIRDIHIIIKSGLVLPKYILQNLIYRREFGMINSYWHIFIHTETDDLICQSIVRMWNFGVCIAVKQKCINTFICIYEQFLKLISNLNLEKKAWRMIFFKIMGYIPPIKYRSIAITNKVFIRLICIKLIHRAKYSPRIRKWLMSQNNILDWLPEALVKNLISWERLKDYLKNIN